MSRERVHGAGSGAIADAERVLLRLLQGGEALPAPQGRLSTKDPLPLSLILLLLLLLVHEGRPPPPNTRIPAWMRERVVDLGRRRAPVRTRTQLAEEVTVLVILVVRLFVQLFLHDHDGRKFGLGAEHGVRGHHATWKLLLDLNYLE